MTLCMFFHSGIYSPVLKSHRQEHRKRDKKSKTRCPFLSVETVVPPIKAPPRSRSRKPKNDISAVKHTEPEPEPEPPLSTSPVERMVSVTENVLDMTVEEWIRHEMSLQYGNFKADGETMIGLFKERTTEVRRIIQAL
jgi:hypothetical protein